MKKPKLSVIIPTHNEESDISNALKSLNKQSFKDFEVIVVDGSSTDNTVKEVKKFKKVILIEGSHKGPGHSRNLGAKKAFGDILIFVDADMTFHKDYLKNLVTPILKDDKVIGTCHDLELVKNIKNIWSRCWGRIRVSKNQAKHVTIFRAIRKSIFLKLGGFDPKYGYADDQTLWFKHNVRSIPAKDTTCYHQNPETLRKVYNQSRWIGASLDYKILRLKGINYLIPPILIVLSPIIIPFISIRKIYKNRDPVIFLPMLIFMTLRYFGSIDGISRKIYLGTNFR